MNDIYFLAFSASLVSFVLARIVVVPDGRIFEIPDPHTYSYVLEEESPASINRLYILSNVEPQAALLCPKGYSIQEMRQELVVNETLSHLIPSSILSEQLISLRNFESNDDYKRAFCPTAYHCLGYQACLFTYSNDFCKREPFPSFSFILSVGCFRDDLFEAPIKFRKNKDFVLFIQYAPNGKVPDGGFSLENLTYVESAEEKVFNGKCPPLEVAKQQGYFGKCVEYPPTSSAISLLLWSALGKVQSENCRTKVIQTLCALHYNSQGLCMPPIYRNHDSENKKIFNAQVLPEHKYSFTDNKYKKFLNKSIPDLIASRLAFVIMSKKNIKGTITVLQHIYREHFLYVVHMDKEETQLRTKLEIAIEESFPMRHNIVLLPLEKSFSTTFDSYETVRAKMEAYEYLLHFGIWDFVITLSEDDVPLRNSDDLAIALSPHRGFSFLPDLHIIEQKKITPAVSCEGLIHEFSSLSDTLKTKSNPFVCISTDDGIFSREFVKYLVDENKHSKEINEEQFFLQTVNFSHNSYIPTLLMNSPYNNSVHTASIRVVKKQLQKIIVNARTVAHNNSIEFRKNFSEEKEYFSETDDSLINQLAHKFFFIRKLTSQSKNDAQKVAIQLANGDYYQHLEKMLPVSVIRSLLEETMKKISAILKIPSDGLSIENVINLQIVPSLVAQKEICRSEIMWIHSEFSNDDYNYWLEVLTYSKRDEMQRKMRIMLQPSTSLRQCFQNNNLRMISLFPRYSAENQDTFPDWSNFEENMPVPYFSTNIKGVVIHFLVTDEAIPFIERGNIISFKSKSGGSIELKISVISPKETVTCFKSTKIVLSKESGAYMFKYGDKSKDFFVKQHSLSLTCNNMEPGFWTVKINQKYPRILKEYALQFYVLDVRNEMDMPSKDIGSLWKLKHFAFLSKNDSYDFYFDEKEQTSNFVRQKIQKTRFATSEKSGNHYHKDEALELDETTVFKRKSGKAYIFICGGGLISSFAVFLAFIVLFCGWRFRFHPKIVMCFILMLCLITLLQITAIVTVCK